MIPIDWSKPDLDGSQESTDTRFIIQRGLDGFIVVDRWTGQMRWAGDANWARERAEEMGKDGAK